MVDFRDLKTTLAYVRLGLVSMTAAILPVTATAQELCGIDLFAGEPDAAGLMNEMNTFFDILEGGGIVAFDGLEGRVTIEGARQALQEGVGSAQLLSCVIEAEAFVFETDGKDHIVSCGPEGSASLVQPVRADLGPPSRPWPVVGPVETASIGRSQGSLFCTPEVAAFAQYLGSQA